MATHVAQSRAREMVHVKNLTKPSARVVHEPSYRLPFFVWKPEAFREVLRYYVLLMNFNRRGHMVADVMLRSHMNSYCLLISRYPVSSPGSLQSFLQAIPCAQPFFASLFPSSPMLMGFQIILCIGLTLAEMSSGHRGGGEGRTRFEILATVECGEAMGSVGNDSDLVANLSSLFTDHGIMPAKQNDTDHLPLQNKSNSELVAAGASQRGPDTLTTIYFIENAHPVVVSIALVVVIAISLGLCVAALRGRIMLQPMKDVAFLRMRTSVRHDAAPGDKGGIKD